MRMKSKQTHKKRTKIITGIVLFLLFICVVGSIWYVNDYYRSDSTVEQYMKKTGDVTITEIKDGLFLDGIGETDALIFYPGAKVEYTAYIPMLYQLAENGVDVFLIKMPCNLAFLGKNKATDIIDTYRYEHWYLGGHSLGGAMAASYAADNSDKLDGLVLFAAYPTSSLKGSGLSVLSVYGSEDGVLNMEKVKQGRSYMPDTYTELSINGGNHGQFGNYGIQKDDGKALITAKEQQKQTVEAILQMISNI